jgi:hypothetical protein
VVPKTTDVEIELEFRVSIAIPRVRFTAELIDKINDAKKLRKFHVRATSACSNKKTL